MPEASEVTNRNLKPSVPGLPTLDRDVVLMLGITKWGPVNSPQFVVDWDDFKRKYGDFILGYETAIQAQLHLEHGGRKMWVNRVVDIDSNGDPVSAAKASVTDQTGATAATKGTVLGSVVGPFALVNGDTLVGSVDGNGNQTATFTGAAADVTSGNTETYALSDSQTLTVKIDGGTEQTITFLTGEFVAIGAATAEEVCAVINAKISGAFASGTTDVTITSDKIGSDSKVQVTGGTANTALNFSTSEQSGSGNVADMSSVTVTEIKTVVEAAWTNGSGVTVSSVGGAVQIETNVAGASGSIQVISSSTADDELGLDNAAHAGSDGAAQNTLKVEAKYYGSMGDDLTHDITDASDGVAAHFNLLVYLEGSRVEFFQNLTMDSTDDANYAENRINTLPGLSDFIVVADQAATGTALQRRPANATGVALTGGDDGLTGLSDADFIGTSGNRTGLYAFDNLEASIGDILVCPDRPTAAVNDAALTYCMEDRRNFAVWIPDVPAGYDDDAVITYVQTLTKGQQWVGLAWPRIKVKNPDKAVYGVAETILVAASGLWSARMARNTRKEQENVGKQPMNRIWGRLDGASGVETDIVNDIKIRRKVTPFRINPVRYGQLLDGSFGVWVDDTIAGAEGDNWTSVGELRFVSFVRKTVSEYMEDQRGTGNSEDSRLDDQLAIEGYLATWLPRKVFVSRKASDAFYVNTDVKGKGINNPLEQEAEKYHVIIGLATAKSRRIIDLGFTRDRRAVANYIQQQLAG